MLTKRIETLQDDINLLVREVDRIRGEFKVLQSDYMVIQSANYMIERENMKLMMQYNTLKNNVISSKPWAGL